MVNFSTPPGLEGLFDLDRQGVDIRPTLLRVLTDQYLQSPTHTPEAERHFTELALRLIDETEIATRAAVAARLAPHTCAPRIIVLQLARDVVDVAEPVLLHSPLLTPADFEAIVNERGAIYAAIIARRGKPTAASTPPRQTLPAMQPNQLASEKNHEAHGQPEIAAEAEPACASVARELCELFFAADSQERRHILLNLDYAAWPAEVPSALLQRADIWRLETAALRRNTAAVVRELEGALAFSHQQARRIVEDEQGEPIVVAAKAMKMPADVLLRILLFMNPLVGQSVDRVYELADLYREISVDSARRLVAIIRSAETAKDKLHDTRVLHSAAETARRSLTEAIRAPAQRRGSLPAGPVATRAESA